MRNKLLLVFAAITLMNCNSEELEEDVLNGDESEFFISSSTKYRFLNEKGENLIDINNIKTFPISHTGSFKEIDEDKIERYENNTEKKYTYYGGNIMYNEQTKISYYTPTIHGFDKAKTYDTYIRINEKDTDTITMIFTTHGDCNGRPYCSDTHELYYNGTRVYSDGKYSKEINPNYIDIIKKQGKTEVKLIK